MRQGFVSDGRFRFERSEEFQSRCRELRCAVAIKYADKLSTAGPLRRLLVRFRMHQEYCHLVREISPSPQSLWFGCMIQGTAGSKALTKADS
jgi:hypothetical protein